MKQILTVAGSDSGGGAGIQADIKAISANGGFAMSAIVAVTAQNTQEVAAACDLPLDIIRAQLDAVFSDFEVAGVKTGMLSSSEIVGCVSESLSEHGARNLVVDPVMISKSGFRLLRDEAVEAVRRRLLPIARVVTPNTHEAELLCGAPVRTLEETREAAQRIGEFAAAVIVKGGHLEDTDRSVDVLFDGESLHEFDDARVEAGNTHGTGCTYSAALVTFLGMGRPLVEATRAAKTYTLGAIRHAPDIGHGHGPIHHFFEMDRNGK